MPKDHLAVDIYRRFYELLRDPQLPDDLARDVFNEVITSARHDARMESFDEKRAVLDEKLTAFLRDTDPSRVPLGTV